MNLNKLYDDYLCMEDIFQYQGNSKVENIYKEFKELKNFNLPEVHKKIIILRYLREKLLEDNDVVEPINEYKKNIFSDSGYTANYNVLFDRKQKNITGYKTIKHKLIKEKSGSFFLELLRSLSIPNELTAILHPAKKITFNRSGSISMISEYIPGDSLNELSLSRLTPNMFYSIIYNITASLTMYSNYSTTYGIQQGSIHGDLHSKNIIVLPDGTPKLIDWGQSSLKRVRGKQYPNLAPEFFTKDSINSIDGKADVFALGVLIFKELFDDYPYKTIIDQSGDIVVESSKYDLDMVEKTIENIHKSNPDSILKEYTYLINIIPKMLEPDIEKRIGLVELYEYLDKYPKKTRSPIFRFNKYDRKEEIEKKENILRSIITLGVFGQHKMQQFVESENGNKSIVNDLIYNQFARLFFDMSIQEKCIPLLHLGVAFLEGEIEHAWSTLFRILDLEARIPKEIRKRGTRKYSDQDKLMSTIINEFDNQNIIKERILEKDSNFADLHVFVVYSLIGSLQKFVNKYDDIWVNNAISILCIMFAEYDYIDNILSFLDAEITNYFVKLDNIYYNNLKGKKLFEKPDAYTMDFIRIFNSYTFLVKLRDKLTKKSESDIDIETNLLNFLPLTWDYASVVFRANKALGKHMPRFIKDFDSSITHCKNYLNTMESKKPTTPFHKEKQKERIFNCLMSLLNYNIIENGLNKEETKNVFQKIENILNSAGFVFEYDIQNWIKSLKMKFTYYAGKTKKPNNIDNMLFFFSYFDKYVSIIEIGLSKYIMKLTDKKTIIILVQLGYLYTFMDVDEFLNIKEGIKKIKDTECKIICQLLFYIRLLIFCPYVKNLSIGQLQKEVLEIIRTSILYNNRRTSKASKIIRYLISQLSIEFSRILINSTDLQSLNDINNVLAKKVNGYDPVVLLCDVWTSLNENKIHSMDLCSPEDLVKPEFNSLDSNNFIFEELKSKILSFLSPYKKGTEIQKSMFDILKTRYCNTLEKVRQIGNVYLYRDNIEYYAYLCYFNEEYGMGVGLLDWTDRNIWNFTGNQTNRQILDRMGEHILINNDAGFAPQDQYGLMNEVTIDYTKEAELEKSNANYKQASKIYQKALAIDPFAVHIFNDRANVLKNFNINLAIAHYKKALELTHNNYPDSYYGMAIAYLNNGQEDKAKQNLYKYMQLNPNDKDATEFWESFRIHKYILTVRNELGQFYSNLRKKILNSSLTIKEVIPDFTPLMISIIFEDKEAFEFLLAMSNGISTNYRTSGNGNTALEIAVMANQYEYVEALLLNNANPNIASNSSANPLYHAVYMGNIQIAELLIKYGADVNTVYADNNTLLLISIAMCNFDIANMLIAKEIDVNKSNQNNWTPIIYAAYLGNKELCENLINNNADINYVLPNGQNALHFAVRSNDLDCVRLFISKGIDIDAKVDSHLTSLMEAAKCGYYSIAEELLLSGANSKIRNKNGCTASQVADLEGHYELAKFISNY